MMLDAALAYLHFLSVFGVFSALSMEAVLLRPALVGAAARWLIKLDLAYFIAAILAVLSGVSRAIWGVKGWAFYAHQPLFHAKIGVFIVIGLLSMIPTRLYLRWSKAAKTLPDESPIAVDPLELRRARRWVMIEIHLLLFVPLCAVLMSRGI